MPRVVVGPSELLALFSSACEWAERISVCFARADSARAGMEAWRQLERQIHKVDRAILNLDSGSAEPLLVRALNARGVLRVAPGSPAVMNANVYLFRSGPEARVLLGSADFSPTAFEYGISAVVYAAGDVTDEFFCGVRRLVERCAGLAHVPTLEDLDAYVHTWTRAKSMLPPPPSAIATISLQEELRTLDDREQIAACINGLSAAVDSSRKYGDITLHEDDSRWLLHFGGDESAGSICVWISGAGPCARCDAVFVEGVESGRRYLAYRAVFRHRTRVAEELFWRTTRYRPAKLPSSEEDGECRVALVCELGNVEAAGHLAAFGVELRRIREDLDEPEQDEPEQALNFLGEDVDVQLDLVWNVLVGRGALEKDAAIRAAAQALRTEGAVSYKRLDRDGQLYAAIASAIETGCREGSFDRPRRGHVRAAAEELGADDWRYCLVATLGEDPTPRPEATRAAAEFAAEYFGIEFKRLRQGGRIDKAVKSAINSCLRRGLIRDVGNNSIRLATE